jgi:hypothetical protein
LFLFFAATVLSGKPLHAQPKPKFLQHQLDFGINYGLFLGNRSQFTGIGALQHWDFKRQELLTPYLTLNKLNYTNIYWAYKLIINEKHNIKFSRVLLVSDWLSPANNKGLIGFGIYMYNLGYGYQLPFKKIKTTLFVQVNKRTGMEGAKIGHDGYHGYYADLKYDSYGISLGTDLEYFFTKNFGLGANIYYYYFPFETNKLAGDDVQYVDKNIIDSYRPINDFFLINFKVAYKFSLPKFGKKKK